VFAWPLCVRASLPLRDLLCRIHIIQQLGLSLSLGLGSDLGLSLSLSLGLSLSSGFGLGLGAQPCEVGAPYRRHRPVTPSK
jgi:hypothetical protein